MNEQYTGITGFMNKGEVNAVLAPLPENFGIVNGKQVRKVMIGMLVSGKTMKGLSNKWPGRYPVPEAIPKVFVDDPRVLNLVHYNTKETDPTKIVDELCKIEQMAGPYFHGFQLNMVWPDPKLVIEAWLTRNQPAGTRKQKTIVLQCGGTAMAELENSPEKLEAKLAKYEGFVDYVLIDPSGGIGIPFDPEFAIKCFERLYNSESFSKTKFGIAGGLSPDTLPGLLTPVLERFPQISIDAEGKLRTPEDALDVAVAIEYLTSAEKLYRTYEPVKQD